jgi:hypothetical protein
MCQSLVDKVTRSRQLAAVADPETLVLFEEWLEEMEREVVTLTRKTPSPEASDLARQLGLSQAGAEFLLARLKREGKL